MMDVTAAVAESARVFGLTLKEKQLEAIGIHYQQAMESPLQDVSSISSNSFHTVTDISLWPTLTLGKGG